MLSSRSTVTRGGIVLSFVATAGCVTFTREVPARLVDGSPEEARRRLPETELLELLGSEPGIVRLVSVGNPDFALLITADGLVRFVGGMRARCYGTLVRHIQPGGARDLATELYRSLVAEQSHFTDLAPNATRFVLEVRCGEQSTRKVFYSDIDNPAFYRAIERIGETAGVRSLWPPAPLDRHRPPEDCSGRPMFP